MDFFNFISQQYWLVGALLVLIYIFVWNEKRRGGKSLTTHEVTRMMNKDEGVVVDLREAAEFKSGHIVNAINIPFKSLENRWEELLPNKEKTIILVDKMGQHAGSAGNTLRTKEFQVTRLGGGMSEWQNQNLPLVK